MDGSPKSWRWMFQMTFFSIFGWWIFRFQPVHILMGVPNGKITFPHRFGGTGTFSTCTDGRIQHDGIHRIYGNGISQKDQRLTPQAQLFTGCDGCTKSCEANRELLVETPNSHGKPDGKKGHDFFFGPALKEMHIKGTIFLGQNKSRKDGAKMLKLHTVPLICFKVLFLTTGLWP